VLLLRRDQFAAQRALAGWEWWAADPPGTLRPWRPGEILPPDVHDIWCRTADSWQVQVMLDESDGDDWVSRRDPRVRRKIETIGKVSSSGIPYLAPEIQLFYKSRSPRAKDTTDLHVALPLLSATQRRWLADAITKTGGSHTWLEMILEDRLA